MPSPNIVYENDELLVINKPFGLITHPKNKNDDQPSLSGWLMVKYPDLGTVGEPFIASGHPLPRAGIVHRLDKDTSGLIIVAKNEKSFLYLKNLFQSRKIEKNYLVLVVGRPKQSQGVIDLPLGRIGLKRTTKIKGDKALKDKKEAMTVYKTLKNYEQFTLIQATPKTGRTHQIRVHMKAINCPVAGDHVYAPKNAKKPDGLKRLFLHAWKLSFIGPSGQALSIEADLPDDLKEVIEGLDKSLSVR